MPFLSIETLSCYIKQNEIDASADGECYNFFQAAVFLSFYLSVIGPNSCAALVSMTMSVGENEVGGGVGVVGGDFEGRLGAAGERRSARVFTATAIDEGAFIFAVD